MDNLTWPLGIKGDDFYKVLEWSFISHQIDEYLKEKFEYFPLGREPEDKLFGEFIAYALKDVSLNALNRNAIHKLNVNCEPKDIIDTVWNKLGDCVLDDTVDTTIMPRVVLQFLDTYALNHDIVNTYNIESLSKIKQDREKRSRDEAWQIVIRGSEYQKRLMKGSSVSDEIDSILRQYNITMVLPNVSEVNNIDDIDFLYQINDDEPKNFVFLQDKTHINNEFLALMIGYSSASIGGSVKIESDKKDPSTFVSGAPYLVPVVMNLKPQVNEVKRKINKNAKITK